MHTKQDIYVLITGPNRKEEDWEYYKNTNTTSNCRR